MDKINDAPGGNGGQPTITWEEFERISMVVGTIVRCEPFPEARNPSYKLWVDIGNDRIRQSSAQITVHYTPQGLIGKKVLCVTNFAPKRIAGFMSEILVCGFYLPDKSVILVLPDARVANGTSLR